MRAAAFLVAVLIPAQLSSCAGFVSGYYDAAPPPTIHAAGDAVLCRVPGDPPGERHYTLGAGECRALGGRPAK
jgi:hypothetical protein